MGTGQTVLDIRVSFLKRRSWIKKAKPRDEVESPFPGNLWERGSFHPLLPHTHHVGPEQVEPEAEERKKAIRLSHGSQTLSQLLHVLPLAWLPFLHSHTRVHAHTHITHLAGHSHSLASVLRVRGGTPSWDSSKVSGLRSGGIGVALRVGEQNLHIQRRSGFRSSDLRRAH